jgi:hypothetical protein
MRRRAVALAVATVAAAFGAPAVAQAELMVAVTPSEARYAQAHHVVGRLTDAGGSPIPDRQITIQARPWPFTARFRPVATARSGADGRFDVPELRFERNADVRAVAFDGTMSGIARAWTYPAFRLRFEARSETRIRLIQDYRVPEDVRLRATTLFYVGRSSATSVPVRGRGRPRRIARGRWRATATVELPAAWKGHFRFASCFGYTGGSGMGNPARGCPDRFAF